MVTIIVILRLLVKNLSQNNNWMHKRLFEMRILCYHGNNPVTEVVAAGMLRRTLHKVGRWNHFLLCSRNFTY